MPLRGVIIIYMKKVLNFLSSLRRNNNREWFNSHKDEYLDVKARVESLTNELITQVAAFKPEASLLSPSDCTYRIYRDSRFSQDKSPYKNHIGIFINPPFGKKSMRCGWYLHLEPGACMVGGGQICIPPKLLKAIRRSIVDNIDEYRSIVESDDFQSLFPGLPGSDFVKTSPQGFAKDWPFIDYIRPRDYVIGAALTDDFIKAPDLAARLEPWLRQTARFNDFINYTVEEEGF